MNKVKQGKKWFYTVTETWGAILFLNYSQLLHIFNSIYYTYLINIFIFILQLSNSQMHFNDKKSVKL